MLILTSITRERVSTSYQQESKLVKKTEARDNVRDGKISDADLAAWGGQSQRRKPPHLPPPPRFASREAFLPCMTGIVRRRRERHIPRTTSEMQGS